MTTAQFEEVESPEVEAVLRWRFEELMRAGFDAAPARARLSTRDGAPDRAVNANFPRSGYQSPLRRGMAPTPPYGKTTTLHVSGDEGGSA